MFGCSLQRIHHRDAPQRVGTEVEHQGVPVGGDHRRRATASGTGPGTRPGSPGGARSPPSAPAASSTSALGVQAGEEGLLGPQVVVLRGPPRPAGGRPSRGRGGPGRPRAAGAWPPSPACRPATSGRSRGRGGPPPSAPAPAAPTRLVAQARQAPVLGVLAGQAEELPLHVQGRGRASRRPGRAGGPG